MILAAMSVGAAVSASAPSSAAPRCWRATVSLARGDAITPERVEPAQCSGEQIKTIVFDRRARVSRAAADISAGVYLGKVIVTAMLAEVGSRAKMTMRVGQVTVARDVTLVQASHGHQVFVRTADDEVFAAPTSALKFAN